ncbi:MAG TPA: glycoside hydrolase family 88 protein [Opitutaceae bacterium]|nr:glycoside hydrolase family 88 protein [Opitutaceae bacterium]
MPRTAAAAGSFGNWPAGASPAEVGKRVAEKFVERKLELETNPRRFVIYPEVISWYGALSVAKLTHDDALRDELVRKFDYLMTPEGAKRVSSEAHVDYAIFGAVPLEIYMQTKDPKYLKLGLPFADKQWEHTTPDGITTQARYWSDDMYMLPLIQVQAYRATGNLVYLDRAALTMAAYLDKLQKANGLFLHSEDSPFYWARGNGWVAAGMAELLTSLPANHPRRARIMQGYTKMMASLLKYQSPEGLWRQLIDQPDFWLETSGTGMFAFAMVTGVKQGWLDAATYGPAARKAWLGMVAHIGPDAQITDVCVGTNKAASVVGPDLAVQRKFYFDRERHAGDLHGQAPVLWTAAALMR